MTTGGEMPPKDNSSRSQHMERRLTLRQMRIFKSAVDHRNFTKAAEALGLTQPAITQQIQSLERIIGEALFYGRGPAELTPMGGTVYEKVCRILVHVRELDRAANNADVLIVAEVRVTGDTTFGTYVLPKAVAAFQSRMVLSSE